MCPHDGASTPSRDEDLSSPPPDPASSETNPPKPPPVASSAVQSHDNASAPPTDHGPATSAGVAPSGPVGSPVVQHRLSEKFVPVRQLYEAISREVGKLYVGQEELVLGTLTALFAGGHVLIESVPGLGKTLFVRTLGQVLGCEFGRIQFTADLMPSDITGAPVFDMQKSEFRFRPGPVFTQLLLADEINRSPAKTHAALLEIMQEYRVTVDGTSHRVPKPFLVLATQNPLESEGTYNLPEAQLDRFMFKLRVDYPDSEQEAEILKLHSQQMDLNKRLKEEVSTVANPELVQKVIAMCGSVNVEDSLVNYINQIVRATRTWPAFHIGASPRAGLALMQSSRTLAAFSGRDFAIPDDVVEISVPALRHRVQLTAEAEIEGRDVDEELQSLLRGIEVPRN